LSICVLTLSQDVLINFVRSSLQINFLRQTLRRDSVETMRVNGVCMVHCPGGTLILPHYGLQSQKFLPCLFTLDILMWMCSCFALKNLTELRPKCWRFCFAFSHKKFSQDQKIVVKKLPPHDLCCSILGSDSPSLFS